MASFLSARPSRRTTLVARLVRRAECGSGGGCGCLSPASCRRATTRPSSSSSTVSRPKSSEPAVPRSSAPMLPRSASGCAASAWQARPSRGCSRRPRSRDRAVRRRRHLSRVAPARDASSPAAGGGCGGCLASARPAAAEPRDGPRGESAGAAGRDGPAGPPPLVAGARYALARPLARGRTLRGSERGAGRRRRGRPGAPPCAAAALALPRAVQRTLAALRDLLEPLDLDALQLVRHQPTLLLLTALEAEDLPISPRISRPRSGTRTPVFQRQDTDSAVFGRLPLHSLCPQLPRIHAVL